MILRRLAAVVAVLLAYGAASGFAEAPSGVITFTMPRDGWATIAIDDAGGARVRNLFGDMRFTAGPHSIEWDGCDDNGKSVPPGEYHWVGLSRGEMHAVYKGSFQYGTPPWLYGATGGWTADHSAAEAVVAVGGRVLIGSPEAEAGHGLIAANLDGRKQWGVVWLAKKTWCGVEALAAVGDRVFANSYPEQNTVWEVDPASGQSWIVLQRQDLPADKTNTAPALPCVTAPGLRIAGGHAGELYIADLYGREPRTYVFAPGKAPGGRLALLRTLPVRPWGLAWLPDGRCVAALDHTVEFLDTHTGATTPLVSEGLSAPFGIATDSKGRIYISDQGATGIHRFDPDGQLQWRGLRLGGESSQQVKIFDSAGHLLCAIGKKGGRDTGAFDPNSFYQPAGIAVDERGHLWVTEFSRQPKRVTVWDIPDDLKSAAPTLAHQYTGPAMYGGGAAMIEPDQPWRLMDTDCGVIYDVNIATGASAPVDVPWRLYDPWKEAAFQPGLPFMGKPSMGFPLDGRKFGVCNGGYGNGPEAHWEPYRCNATGPVMIGEYKGGRFVPMAAIGTIRNWLRDRELLCRRDEQWLPPVVLEAARKLPDWPKYATQIGMAPDAPDVPHVSHDKKSGVFIVSKWPRQISGFIWVDKNGDGQMEPDEIQFHDFPDADTITFDKQLNAYIPSDRKPDLAVYRLRRQGFNANGAPVYDWNALDKLSSDSFGVDQVGDDGSMLSANALHTAQGKLIWSYPIITQRLRSLGSNIRGALFPGHIYSINSMQGVVQGPGNLGQIYMAHSGDGMSYFLTRDDGLFICTMFRPFPFALNWDTIPEAKPGMLLDDYSVGEESFNGNFSRAGATGQGFEKDHYYMTGMSRSAVVELTGLEGVQRFAGGSVSLRQGAGLYGKGAHFDPSEAGQTLPTARKAPEPLAAVPIVPGMDAFHGKPAQFATATVWTAWDKRGLHMKWHVEGDTSPFINNEPDWTRAFVTGDVCDLQIQSPALGRCRYIITMNLGNPVVVRFRYDAKDNGQGQTYRSSILDTHVPVVEKLDIVPSVRRGKGDYFVQVNLPWDVLGIDPHPGFSVPMELGVFYSDPTGHKTAAREYWHSRISGMVSDVPTEAQITPDWGVLQLQ